MWRVTDSSAILKLDDGEGVAFDLAELRELLDVGRTTSGEAA